MPFGVGILKPLRKHVPSTWPYNLIYLTTILSGVSMRHVDQITLGKYYCEFHFYGHVTSLGFASFLLSSRHQFVC